MNQRRSTTSPGVRAGTILSDCAVAAVVTTAERATSLAGTAAEAARCLAVEHGEGGLRFGGAALARARRQRGGITRRRPGAE